MSDPAAPAASPAAPAAPAPAAPAASPAPAAPASAAPASPAPAATPPATPAAPAADPNAAAAAAKAAEEAARKAAEGAPEKYEPFKAPEGTTLNESVLTEFGATAKELNLSQAKAQQLIDKLAPVIAKQNGEQINATLAKADADWLAASKADAEFGGANFDANVAVAKKGIDTFATPAFKQFLNDSRLGNHPEWVRFAYRVGKAISPDGKHVAGGVPGAGEKSLEQRLYGSQTQT